MTRYITTENALSVNPEVVRKYLYLREKQVLVVTAAAISWQEDLAEEALLLISRGRGSLKMKKKRRKKKDVQ